MEQRFSISRTLDAPRNVVWDAWTDPAQAKQWWGPRGFTCPVYEADLRRGGKAYLEMQAPDGTRYPNAGIFEDVVAPESIVMNGSVEIEPGKKAFDAHTSVRFTETNGKTTIDVEQSFSNLGPGAEFAIQGAPEGWKQQFDKFEEFLARKAAQS